LDHSGFRERSPWSPGLWITAAESVAAFGGEALMLNVKVTLVAVGLAAILINGAAHVMF
jgi:hypothetical protein